MIHLLIGIIIILSFLLCYQKIKNVDVVGNVTIDDANEDEYNYHIIIDQSKLHNKKYVYLEVIDNTRK